MIEAGRGVRRIPQSFYLGLLTIALEYAIFHDGGMVLRAWNVCLLILALTALVCWSRNTQALRPMKPYLAWPVMLFPAYVALQLLPLPLFLLRILSPARAGLVDSLGSVMRVPAFAPIAIAPSTTLAYLFRIVAYTVTFLLIRDIASRRSARPWAPAIALIAIGSVEAIWGLLQNAAGNAVEGSYANKNHFAGLLEMILPLALMSGIALLRSGDSYLRVSTVLKAAAVLALAAMIFAAILYSMSRMAVVSTMAALFVMGSLAAFGQGVSAWKKLLAGGCLVVILLLVFIYLPPDELIKRFGEVVNGQSASSEGRWPIWRDTLRLIGSYPLLGCGLGNYDVAFLKFQTAVVDREFTFAHNDFLELFAELGAIGFLIVASLMLAIFAIAVRAATRTPERGARYLGLGCVGGITAICVHSVADFNMYIPANALLLCWISGIAAGLPNRPARHAIRSRVSFRSFAIALSFLLVVYASSILFARTAERDGTTAAIPRAQLLDALRTDPAAPNRWCDLGDAAWRSGELKLARKCFANALALGPNIPPVLLRAAEFYYGVHETEQALRQTSRILGRTDTYDGLIFDWYEAKKVPVREILSYGLPGGPRASRAYLRHLIGIENAAGSAEAWNWVVSHAYADDRLAVEYVDYLFSGEKYEAAAASWAQYAAGRQNGYPEANRIFNGDFESDPTRSRFDWTIEPAPGVAVAFDREVRYSGRRSLRIQFDGTQNVSNIGVSEAVFLVPGPYRFQAYARTQDITTDEGVAFSVVDPNAPKQLNFTTEAMAGSSGWKLIEHAFQVLPGTGLVQVSLVRKPSLKFDNLIRGTVWIDDVSIRPANGVRATSALTSPGTRPRR